MFRSPSCPAGVVEELRVLSEEKSQALSIEFVGNLPVEADRSLLHQAVANVLHNAIRCTPENGDIRVRTDLDEAGFAAISMDTGPGIPESDRDKAVDRFYPLDNPDPGAAAVEASVLPSTAGHLRSTEDVWLSWIPRKSEVRRVGSLSLYWLGRLTRCPLSGLLSSVRISLLWSIRMFENGRQMSVKQTLELKQG